jgi:hypothetical protein
MDAEMTPGGIRLSWQLTLRPSARPLAGNMDRP